MKKILSKCNEYINRPLQPNKAAVVVPKPNIHTYLYVERFLFSLLVKSPSSVGEATLMPNESYLFSTERWENIHGIFTENGRRTASLGPLISRSTPKDNWEFLAFQVFLSCLVRFVANLWMAICEISHPFSPPPCSILFEKNIRNLLELYNKGR